MHAVINYHVWLNRIYCWGRRRRRKRRRRRERGGEMGKSMHASYAIT
jgi:hypothetical protein